MQMVKLYGELTQNILKVKRFNIYVEYAKIQTFIEYSDFK